jgi:hypothetical protein
MKSFIRRGRNTNAGFCTIVNDVIKHCRLHYERFNNLDISIDIEELSTIFNIEKKYDDSEYTIDIDREYSKIFEDESWRNNLNDYKIISAHEIIDIDVLVEKNTIYENIFKFKYDDIYENNFDKTLGIHIRGTDKYTEVKPIETNEIFKKVDEMFDNYYIDSIYLATDDYKYLDMFNKKYNGLVKFNTNNIISKDNRPIHFIEDRTEINKQVMIDINTLTKCPYFLYNYSNVSYLALTIGINKFKAIHCINNDKKVILK